VRIVGGRFKGRRLVAPEGRDVRPTPDRARESIFNILAHADFAPDLEGASVVDIFAGTGAMGLEAMSRGATTATFLEIDPRARAAIIKNAGTMGQASTIRVLNLNATMLPPPPRIAKCPATVIFLDPPYGEDVLPGVLLTLLHRGWAASGTLCVAETPSERDFDPPRGYSLADQRTYGAALVSFLLAN